ncbi:MAG: polysaccharide deacetylase family protein [Gammaproteobacteria bacterium]|nr:polysaccharide deacetylase family protein [Gammaproteobacteria bacterium]MDH5594930.1 polysaccharide deacetylase family protein [Gammaproteobacteria bacterium]
MPKMRFIFSIIALVFCVFPAHAETNVIITIDVESFTGGYPERDIYGKLDGHNELYGTPKILDILKKYNAKATFYLNVYEIAEHGEKPIKDIAQKILAYGQDLQLHTHLLPMYGKAALSHFELDKQIEILGKGKLLIKEWTGYDVVAHRAGAYKANMDTMTALAKNNIFIDSSLSPASKPPSPLSRKGYLFNDISEIAGITQLPITYFEQLRIGNWSSKRFLDIESVSLSELKNILNQFSKEGTCTANIMMHSFSFIRFGYPDIKTVERLDKLLEFISSNNSFTTNNVKDFISSYKNGELNCTPTPDFVPYTGFISTYLRSWERINEGWKNIVFALGVPAILISAIGLPILLLRMRAARK